MRRKTICCAALVGGWAGPTDRSRQNSAKQLISINRKQNAILVMGSITAPTKGASAKMAAGEEGQMRAQLATISVCSRLTMHLPPRVLLFNLATCSFTSGFARKMTILTRSYFRAEVTEACEIGR